MGVIHPAYTIQTGSQEDCNSNALTRTLFQCALVGSSRSRLTVSWTFQA